MTETSKKAIYKHFNGKEYERINLRTTAEQVDVDANHKFVTQDEMNKWNAKAEKTLATQTAEGLMSAVDKKKLDGIASGANNYVHPANHGAGVIVQDASHRFVTDAEKTVWNGKANNSVANQKANGLMSMTDKIKLDGIATGANNYVHPGNHAASMIALDASHRFVTDAEKASWNGAVTNINSVKSSLGTTIKSVVLNAFYPVGSIYMSVSISNPSKTMGGTWVSWGSGRVPVGVNTSDASFSKVEQTGGEKTHVLSVNEMPSHTHDMEMITGQNYVIPNNAGTGLAGGNSTKGHWFTGSVRAAARGGNGAHNNVQPYITCYMWKRTA